MRAGSSDSQAIFVLGVCHCGELSEDELRVLTGEIANTRQAPSFWPNAAEQSWPRGQRCASGDPQRGHLSAHAPQRRRASSRSHRVRGLRLAEMAIMDDKQSAPATPRASPFPRIPAIGTPTVVPLGNSSRVRRGRRLTTPRAHRTIPEPRPHRRTDRLFFSHRSARHPSFRVPSVHRRDRDRHRVDEFRMSLHFARRDAFLRPRAVVDGEHPVPLRCDHHDRP